MNCEKYQNKNKGTSYAFRHFRVNTQVENWQFLGEGREKMIPNLLLKVKNIGFRFPVPSTYTSL